MRIPKGKARHWGLLSSLMVPIILLVVIALAFTDALEEVATSRLSDSLVNQRAATVMDAVLRRLQERAKSNEVYAQLLADLDGLADRVASRDTVGLAALLVPVKTRLGLHRIVVFDNTGTEILRLEAEPDHAEISQQLASARAGITESGVSVSDAGLGAFAVAPIKGSSGIAGQILVGTTFTEADLRDLESRDRSELTVFWNGRMVSHSPAPQALLKLLDGAGNGAADLDALNQRLRPLQFQARSRVIGHGGSLVALVPIGDLLKASGERETVELLGTMVLVAGLLLLLGLLARSMARSMKNMADVAQEMTQGNYRLRINPTGIRELNHLGIAFNHLAQTVETQMEELSRQAFFDPLSGLPNRALFLDRLERALAGSRRRGGCVAVLFLDLDHFKVINDSLGHEAGDQLLVTVAERLRTCIREEDTAARLGGDEFTILLDNVATTEQVWALAGRILDSLRLPCTLCSREVYTSASIGIAISSTACTTPEALLKAADMAMYQAKLNGRGQARLFEESLNEGAQRRLELEVDLRRALERQEFRVFYQPIVELETGAIKGMEALVRWMHPQEGIISPDQFIPLAEETGLIVQLGRWVLQEACRQTRQWQVTFGIPWLDVNVNLSPMQLNQPDLLDDVDSVLRETGLPPASLKLEITETVMLDCREETLNKLRKLRSLGILLAIDDFGQGYSSLGYLKYSLVDIIKIDRSFVNNIGKVKEDTAIVQSIIALAQSLDLTVTAEGIERAEQVERLQALGCPRGQGYRFGRPLPAGESAGVLRDYLDRTTPFAGRAAGLDG